MFIGVELGGICKEYKNYKFLVDSIGNEITKKRAGESLKCYLERAMFFKSLSRIFSGVAIVLPLATTLATSSYITCPEGIIPIITFLTALFSSIQAVSKCNDKKTAYRNYAESLKSELYCFHSKINNYDTSSDQEREKILAIRVDKIIKDSNIKISSLDNDKKPNDDAINEDLDERIYKTVKRVLEEDKTNNSSENKI